jgi:murein DD-endopeptidase MepM/ murein hydrolase activator NlpD/transposase InsO family protein
MKLWLSAAEIADLALPGLPATKRGVADLAEREGWAARPTLSRRRRGAGGGLEFHLDLLPPVARQAYIGRLVPEAVAFETAAAAEAEPAAATLRDDAAEARDARLALIAAAERYRTETRLPRQHADLRFIQEVRAGRIELPVWVLLAARQLSLRTLQRWRATAAAGNTVRLAVDRGAARRGSGVMDVAEDGAVRVFALALITHQPHLSADHVRSLLKARFGETVTVKRAGGRVETVALPPVRTVQDALKRWRISERVALTAMTNPDAFKSRFRATGSATDTAITRPNQLWQIDASPMDALCKDGRHAVYIALDVFTRRIVVYVSRTPRAEAVGLMLRRAILAWGIPERIKTDNGSDFTAKHIARSLAHLGIERELSPAFTPEAKAFVEWAIGTFQRDFGPLLPGFIGHSVADRKVIEARRAFAQRLGDSSDAKAFCVELTAAELQAYAGRRMREDLAIGARVDLASLMRADPSRQIRIERASLGGGSFGGGGTGGLGSAPGRFGGLVPPRTGERHREGSAGDGAHEKFGGGGGTRGAARTGAMMAYAMDQLRREGVPEGQLRESAAHLVGQAQMESGLDPNTSHDGGTGFGIYGARDPSPGRGRRTDMFKWLEKNGYARNSAEGQMRYMAHEAVSGRFKQTRRVLMGQGSGDLERDTDTITREFESPAIINRRSGAVRNALRVGPDDDPTGTRGVAGSRQAGENGQFDPLGGAARRYSSGYGMREHPVHGGRRMHHGQDMAAPGGTSVFSMQAGRVSAINRQYDVTVTHPDGSTKTYRHIAPGGIREGQPVEAGGPLGRLRHRDPRSTGPHLHLEATDAQGRRYDPRGEIDAAQRAQTERRMARPPAAPQPRELPTEGAPGSVASGQSPARRHRSRGPAPDRPPSGGHGRCGSADGSIRSWSPPLGLLVPPQGVGAAAEPGLDEEHDRPEAGEFPAAARILHEEAVGAVHGDDGAHQDRHQYAPSNIRTISSWNIVSKSSGTEI